MRTNREIAESVGRTSLEAACNMLESIYLFPLAYRKERESGKHTGYESLGIILGAFETIVSGGLLMLYQDTGNKLFILPAIHLGVQIITNSISGSYEWHRTQRSKPSLTRQTYKMEERFTTPKEERFIVSEEVRPPIR